MFGWEFPPHITGGLGTACFGLTKGIAKHNVDVIFVVPKAYGDEDGSSVRLVAAENIDVAHTSMQLEEFWKHIQYLEISSNIVPYVDPEEFKKIVDSSELESSEKSSFTSRKQFKFTGKYGPNLMSEVTRYAIIAATLASENHFDVIHAHDWLTYPAGIAAKMEIGRASCRERV